MSYLLKPDKRFTRQKPVRGSRIHNSDPLSKGIVDAWIFNEGGGSSFFNAARQNTALLSAAGGTWQPDGYQMVAGTRMYATGHMRTWFAHEIIWVATGGVTSNGLMGTADGTGAIPAVFDRDLYVDGSGHFVFRIYDGAVQTATGTTTVAAGKRYHVIGVADGSTIKTYVNGVLEATTSAGSAYTGYSTVYTRIGNGNGGDTDGKIVLARVWNQALTAAAVGRLYAEPYCTMAPPRAKRIFPGAPAAPKVPLTGYLSRKYAFFDRGELIS